MTDSNIDLTLERDAREFANDPEFIAEGLSIKVIEEMLKCLEQKGLSQSWLAEKMGVSRAHISRILNAPPNMTLLTIAKIAVALGTNPDVSLSTESEKPCSPEYLAMSVSEPSGNQYKDDSSQKGKK